MTVAELITHLQALPQDMPVKVYEFDGDFWDDVAEVRLNNGPTPSDVIIVGQYGKDIS